MGKYAVDRFAAMETFVCVVEAGSFSAAARRLSVGQPAVSKTVAQLEEHLGVRLLTRSTRGLSPTEAGLHFFERARLAIQEADAAELAARGAAGSLSGRLRVSAAVSFARLHVLPALPRFLAAHPALEVDVILDDRHVDLIEEGIDVSLRMGSLGDSTMTARKISQSPRLVVATPGYLAGAGRPDSPADLLSHQVIVYLQGQRNATWTFRQGSSEASVAVHGRVRVSAAEGVRAAVLADMGLAIASAWMFAPELASGAVEPVLPDWQLPPVELWAVFPNGRLASSKARAFVDFVAAELAAARA